MAALWQRTRRDGLGVVVLDGAEPMLEHPGAGLVALGLPERAGVVLVPDGERVAGELRGLDRVDAAAAGEGAERGAEVLRRDLAQAGGLGRSLDAAGRDVAMVQRRPSL